MANFFANYAKIFFYYAFGKLKFLPREKKQNYENEISFVKKTEIVVVIHIYYVEYVDEIVSYLKNIHHDYDVYVSVCDNSHVEIIRKIFSPLTKNLMIQVHPNRGRDVGPFLTMLNLNFFDDYKYACKIHAKGSKYSSLGSEWRNDILSELLGSPTRVDSILNAMKFDRQIGLVGPSGHHLCSNRYWGDNKYAVETFCRLMNIPPEDVSLDFFAGTMFWFRPRAIAKIKQLRLSIDNIEPENGQRDGTAAHALERLFNLVVNASGFYCTESLNPQAKKNPGDDSNNRVVVIG